MILITLHHLAPTLNQWSCTSTPQYTPSFFGHRQLHILPYLSLLNLRLIKGLCLVWLKLTLGEPKRYSVEKCLGFMRAPQLFPLLNRNLFTLFTRISNWFLLWAKRIYSPPLFLLFLYQPVIVLSIPRSTNLCFLLRLNALHFVCVSRYLPCVIRIHVPPS